MLCAAKKAADKEEAFLGTLARGTVVGCRATMPEGRTTADRGNLAQTLARGPACMWARSLVELALRHDAGVIVARQIAEQEARLRALEALAQPRRRAA